MALQRLQKILAQAGVASRRSAERLILDGRVRVNGRIINELGARANPQRDRVEVDGKRLVAERPVYYLMHKPRGVVTTLDDPEGRKSVKDLLRNIPERLFPVGRLDFQTSGALLLTNDGAMAQSLLHPTRRVPKTYHAKIEGPLEAQRLELLRAGVTLDDGEVTAPAEVDIVRRDDRHTFISVTISEGKNRQIHRMLDAVGRVVMRLTRMSFAGLELGNMRPGEVRPLTSTELSELKQKYLNPSKKLRVTASHRGAVATVQPEVGQGQDEGDESAARDGSDEAAAGDAGAGERSDRARTRVDARRGDARTDERRDRKRTGFGVRRDVATSGPDARRTGFGAQRDAATSGRDGKRTGFVGRRDDARTGERQDGKRTGFVGRRDDARTGERQGGKRTGLVGRRDDARGDARRGPVSVAKRGGFVSPSKQREQPSGGPRRGQLGPTKRRGQGGPDPRDDDASVALRRDTAKQRTRVEPKRGVRVLATRGRRDDPKAGTDAAKRTNRGRKSGGKQR